MFLMTLRSTASSPLASPTPMTAPTTVWDVEMGSPIFEAISTVVAAPKSTENPLVLVRLVMRPPTVFMTFRPQVRHPAAIPTPPRKRSSVGIAAVSARFPSASGSIAATGAIAFATSFAPAENAT